MSTRRPKLPPLVRYQVDAAWLGPQPAAWLEDGAIPAFVSLRKAKSDAAFWSDGPNGAALVTIRRLSDGVVVWRNKAAKEAGL